MGENFSPHPLQQEAQVGEEGTFVAWEEQSVWSSWRARLRAQNFRHSWKSDAGGHNVSWELICTSQADWRLCDTAVLPPGLPWHCCFWAEHRGMQSVALHHRFPTRPGKEQYRALLLFPAWHTLEKQE